ncbi:MAG TPA: biotin--[acetyl-CoA-carboxylase] ligase, partial [Ruminococcaceae bacterium]|nr:biotin--[acetyl-CoA-carboxylase] ligase [Oscillospiraceae bacterium]
NGSLPKRYTELCISLGKEVQFTQDRKRYSGTACGITQNGELLVKLPNGQETAVGSGEVIVQGIYGE